jgi:SET domain-containing protein
MGGKKALASFLPYQRANEEHQAVSRNQIADGYCKQNFPTTPDLIPGCMPYNRLKIKDVLMPPKAKLLDIR